MGFFFPEDTAKLKKGGPELFFSYYGGKRQIAKYYPRPKHKTIIEPFAGSAGYSLHYWRNNVILIDANPIVAGIWQYLLKATKEEILKLPSTFDTVDNLNIPQEAKWMIGFWLNSGASSPSKTPSKWMRRNERPNA